MKFYGRHSLRRQSSYGAHVPWYLVMGWNSVLLHTRTVITHTYYFPNEDMFCIECESNNLGWRFRPNEEVTKALMAAIHTFVLLRLRNHIVCGQGWRHFSEELHNQRATAEKTCCNNKNGTSTGTAHENSIAMCVAREKSQIGMLSLGNTVVHVATLRCRYSPSASRYTYATKATLPDNAEHHAIILQGKCSELPRKARVQCIHPTCFTLAPFFALASINITPSSLAAASPSSVVTCLKIDMKRNQ